MSSSCSSIQLIRRLVKVIVPQISFFIFAKSQSNVTYLIRFKIIFQGCWVWDYNNSDFWQKKSNYYICNLIFVSLKPCNFTQHNIIPVLGVASNHSKVPQAAHLLHPDDSTSIMLSFENLKDIYIILNKKVPGTSKRIVV